MKIKAVLTVMLILITLGIAVIPQETVSPAHPFTVASLSFTPTRPITGAVRARQRQTCLARRTLPTASSFATDTRPENSFPPRRTNRCSALANTRGLR